MPLSPEEEKELRELEADPKLQAADQDDLASMISPDYDPVPQALATLPSTNHPAGERGSEAAWMRKPQGESQGAVFVYEPTLLSVKKRLMDDQAFNAALFPSRPRTPEDIAALTKDSSEVGAASAKWWQETADAAAKSGKVAYRYSYTPWLQGAKEMGALQMLKGSLNPASEGAQAFIMGADDTALFGAVRGAQEAENPQVQGSAEAAGIEHTGGVRPGSAVDYNAEVQAEHPVAYGAGQVAGFLNPISLGGKVFELLGKAGQSVASGARTLVGAGTRVLAGGAAAAAGAGAHQAISEGVDAASSLGRTGTPGTTLGEAAGRVGEVATDPLNAALGAGGHAVSELAGAAARGIAGSQRFKGRIERVEQLGGEVKFGKGPTAPGADEAIAAGKARDVSPDQPIAERIAPEMVGAVKQRHETVKREISAAQDKYYPTREGQMRLPVTNTLEETKRAILQPQGGGPEIVDPQARARDVKANKIFFNQQVAGVSLKPVDGAIELTAEQADSILTPHWKRQALPDSVYDQSAAAGRTAAGAKPAAGHKYSLDGKSLEDLGALPFDEATDRASTLKGLRGSKEFSETGRAPKDFDRQGHDQGITISVDPNDGTLHLIDGRHRFSVAREKGLETIHGTVREAGSGKVLFKGDIPLGKAPGAADAATVPPKGKAAKQAGKVAANPTREADTVRMQEPPEGPGKDDYGRATSDYRQAQKRDNARASALADEANIPGVSLGAPSLKQQLGNRKVYVVPKRYTAEQHEELIRGRQDLSKDPKKPGARDAKRIYQAAFRDRDVRPLDGVEGGWSAMQRRHREMLNAAEEEIALVAPDGTTRSAQEQLSKYARQQAGELPRVNAMQDVGQRAGVGDELRLLRVLDPLGALREQGSLHKPAHAAPPTTAYGALSAGAEALTLRGLYPGLKYIGGPESPIRGGRAGRAGLVDLRGTSMDEDEKEKRP